MSTVNAIANLVKYRYFTVSKELAGMQHRLAELTGTGRLDPADNEDLQRHLHNVYEDLTGGLTSAVIELVDDGYMKDDYGDGSPAVVKRQHFPGGSWLWNEFLLGGRPRG
jgi:hypothetical protein